MRENGKEQQNIPGVLQSGIERSSNLELLRIVSMLLIIAHHYVVNSGITENYNYSNITTNMVFLQLWGMWGKTAINAFVMITGYFMCTSKLTVKRFGKMWLEAKFYVIVIFLVLFFAGYETVGFGSILNLLFGLVRNSNAGFTSSFFMFYLFIPFYNLLIEKMSRRQYHCLLGILIFYFTVVPTFFFTNSVFHEPLWYMVLYFVAAYIRLYPVSWLENNKICGSILIVTILTAYASVLVVDFVGVKFGFESVYYMVSDSNKLFALIVGVFSFLFFKNIKMGNSKIINRIAATTFGVLLIHANSDAMRTFLWKDLLHVKDMYFLPLGELILYSVVCMFGVFIVCSLIDMLRIRFLEKPILNWLGKYDWFHGTLY